MEMLNQEITRRYISSDVRFYTVAELTEMLGWG